MHIPSLTVMETLEFAYLCQNGSAEDGFYLPAELAKVWRCRHSDMVDCASCVYGCLHRDLVDCEGASTVTWLTVSGLLTAACTEKQPVPYRRVE